MIEIDGSYGSGGGQIVRTAIALSGVTKKPVRIFNIRAGRPKPGLMTQHLETVKALSEFFNAETRGLRLGSTDVAFIPGEISEKVLEINLSTAASVGLVFQALSIASFLSGQRIRVTINGGATFGKFSPPMLYIKEVFLEILKRFGFDAFLEIHRHGFYPKGGARTVIEFFPSEGKEINLIERGELVKVRILSVAADSLRSKKVAERQAESAEKHLHGTVADLEKHVIYQKTECPGSGVVVVAEYENSVIGSDGLGEPGKPAEAVGREAAENFMRYHITGACLDRHMSDQI
ncbi:MAG: RNA 3'-phosphate cyclase, partial [Candidatus Micrarchaeota archaeon]|nr:RNA 3'-phosphate cyclase [Candidatus Micrarchaeota archaeon]